MVGGAVAECARHVAHGRTRAVGDDVGDLRGAQAAVALVHVLDDFFAAIALDVEVDVGRPVALSREEPFEQQAERHGVGLGDAERKTHRTVCCTAATLAEDVVALAELHDVPHDEEVAGKTEVLDDVEFVVDGAPRARAQRKIFVGAERTLAVATATSFFDETPQELDF